MVRLLEDIPAAAFQVLLHHLRGPDVATLRLVNRFTCMRATAAPYIVLRITSSTTRDDIRLWARATRRLQDVSAIHVYCSGKVTQETLDAALKLLSRRGMVSQLHLVSAPGSPPANLATWSPHGTLLPSLASLKHLQPHLKHLHISGLAVTDLAGDLAKVAATGQQLQTLVLQDVKWNETGSTTLAAFAAAVLQLPLSYPNLRQLHVNMPAISPIHTTAPLGGATAAQRMEAMLAPAGLLPEHQAAALAVLAAASAQLKQLQSLRITEAPGIWPLRSRRSHLPTADAPGHDFASAAAAAAASVGGAPPLGLPPRGLQSMDTFGSWLLGRLPQLQHLRIATRDAGWAMTWDQRQGALQSSTDCSSSSSSGKQELYGPAPSVTGTYHAFVTARDAAAQPACMGSLVQSSRKRPTPELLSDFTKQFSGYSTRPVSLLLPLVTNLRLSILAQQLPDLQRLLASLVNLRHLKITLLNTSNQPCSFAALVAAASTAGGGQLHSLVLLPGNSGVAVASNMLLPLAACTSLRQLRLVGCFSAAQGNAAAAWGALRQLTSITELCIQQQGPEVLELPVRCLPGSLKSLEGRRLHITGSSSSSAGVDAAAVAAAVEPGLQSLHLHLCQLDAPAILNSRNLQQLTINASCWQGGWEAAAAAWPRLKQFTACCLTAHSTCSSSCHDDASVLDTARMSCRHSSCSGDSPPASVSGAASSAVGPTAPSITSSRPCGYRALGGYNEADSEREMLAAWAADAGQLMSMQLVQQFVAGFSGLESFSVHHIPCITPAVLQCMWRLQALTHLNLATTVVSGEWDDVLRNAAAAESEAGSSSSSTHSSDGSCSCYSGNVVCDRPEALGLKHLMLHVPHITPAGQLLSPAFPATATNPRGGGTRDFSLQQALQQQLPWAGVNVVHARSLPC